MAVPIRSGFAASLVAIATFVSLPVAALTIDDFTAGPFVYSDDTTTTGATFNEGSGLPGANVVGGVRFVSVGVTSPLLPATATATLVTSPVVLAVVGAPDDAVGSFSFIYDGIASDPPGLAGSGGALNLDLSGLTAIRISAINPSAIADVRLTLWNSTTNETLPLKPLYNGITSFDLGDFTLGLGDVRAIRLSILGLDSGETVSLQSILAVPEPTTGLLLGAGLVALAVRRRGVR